MWYPHARKIVDAIQGGLLSVCHLVLDVRRRNSISLSVGSSCTRPWCIWSCKHSVLFSHISIRLGVCLAERSIGMEIKKPVITCKVLFK